MKIFLMLDPPRSTAQMQKVAMVGHKPIFYKPAKVRMAKEQLIKYLRPFIPDKPFEGAVKLSVCWMFPKGRHKNGEWKVTRPDTDNLDKMLKDCMTLLGFWKDDAQVVVEHIEKVWSDDPTGIDIEILPLGKFKENDNATV